MIEKEIFAEIIVDWHQAPFGYKTETLKRWAKVLNISHRQLYRKIQAVFSDTKKTRADKGKRETPHVESWTRKIWSMKLCPTCKKEVFSTKQALGKAIRDGIIPKEAMVIPIGTYNRISRELNLNRTAGKEGK